MFTDTFTDLYTLCPESTIWKFDHPYDPFNREYFITTGRVVGNAGREMLGNWFKIKKFGGGYKLLHCPSMCTYCDVVCKDVGIYVQNGHRRLALTNVPFKVVFKKA
ncbi:Kunitz family trypsin and protease inhibitor protein [Abeliophyllum distichum]|uniref:Kunitz family trypsin and protease inhibitor protein n=1 Tax=Abeliophyllum distichum TaxID=126358 RepID=A0ABD1RBF9_9LAMI